MENEIEETIDTKYLILEKKDSGGTANAFLVQQKGNETEYIAKVLKVEDEETEQYHENEVKYLKILKKYSLPYVLNIIDNGEGPIIRKNRNNGLPLIKKYIVLEFAPNRELADFIILTGTGLGEEKSKAFFYKIIKGIESIHEKGICHRDIKLENILMDGNFNPKFADFDHATENAPNLNVYFGTIPYAAPEIIKNEPYDGFQADIFSLGVTLMNLTFCEYGFDKASKNCKFYQKIISGQKDEYFKLLKTKIDEEISPSFKELFLWMVSYEPKNRPTLKQILSHEWFKSYFELNDDQKKNLDDEVKKEFEKRAKIIEDSVISEIEEYNIESEALNNRSSIDEKIYFNENMKPKKVHKGFDKSFCIKIKGSIFPSRFMNNFCNKLNTKYGEHCLFEVDKNKLKLTAIFEDDENNDDDEKDNENIKGNQITIKIKLYESEEGLLLKLIKVEGSAKNFFDKFKEISEMLKNA